MSRRLLRELPPEETHLPYTAMLRLRPSIGSDGAFVERVNVIHRREGYRHFADEDEQAAAVAGFRVEHYLAG